MAEAGNDFPTIIGPDAVFKGELTFEKGLRLQGRFEGKITATGRLHVTREAKLQADVEGAGVVIEGEVKGNLTASDRVDLKQTARYEGDLRAAKLVVEEGAQFTGHVTVGPAAVNARPAGPNAATVHRPAGMPGQPPPVK